MLFNVLFAGLAFTASFASAYTKPTGDAPEGNPISAPGLGSIVPVGKPYTITWDPTTQGTVTLVLLKGPSSNAVPQYAIVESIANSGSYSWTPKDDLAPGTTGYGIQLIDDSTGAYQYTTQFGISNPSYSGSSASTSASSSKTAYAIGAPLTAGPRPTTLTSTGTDSGAWPTTTAETSTTSDDGSSVTAAETSTTTDENSTWTTSVLSTPSAPAATATTRAHSSGVSSSKAASTSASRTASASTPTATGGASALGGSFAGLVFAAGVAVFAL